MFDSQFEHRSEPRKMHMSRAEISWQLRDGNLCTHFAMTEDISTHGMGLRMKRPIPAGTTVQIKTKITLNKVWFAGAFERSWITSSVFSFALHRLPKMEKTRRNENG